MRAGFLPFILAALLANAAEADSSLLAAAREGRSAEALALLDQRTDPAAHETDGTTALHWAVYRDDAALSTLR